MATRDDVFYARCTFWTGDWDWLARMNREQSHAIHRLPVVMDGRAISSMIPHCPFCGSVGFEARRDHWLRSIQEWDEGTSPKAPGVPHPGYAAMMQWGEKRCYRGHVELEAAHRLSLT